MAKNFNDLFYSWDSELKKKLTLITVRATELFILRGFRIKLLKNYIEVISDHI